MGTSSPSNDLRLTDLAIEISKSYFGLNTAIYVFCGIWFKVIGKSKVVRQLLKLLQMPFPLIHSVTTPFTI